MQFTLSEEQSILKHSVERYLAQAYEFTKRLKRIETGAGMDRQIWQEMADLGLMGLHFAEEDGGFGGGPVETMIVMQAFGRALILEPYLSTLILCGSILSNCHNDELRKKLIPQISEGKLILALGHEEVSSEWGEETIKTFAHKVEGGYKLSGKKTFVLCARNADMFIISARLESDEIGLFLLENSANGLNLTAHTSQDGGEIGALTLKEIFIGEQNMVAAGEDALALLDIAYDNAIFASAAEAVGAMDEALDLTVSYLKNRTQFGQAIGTFQSLQHRASDMYVALEQARSMMYYGLYIICEDKGEARRRALSAVKVQIIKSSRYIGQNAIQLHGGIGLTMEYKLGHLFKRLAMIEQQFGNLEHHLHYLIGKVKTC